MRERGPSHPAPVPLPPILNWFKIANYKPSVALGFHEWSIQIGNRVYLRMLLDNGKLDVFDQFFKRLQANPFDDLGYRTPTNDAVSHITIGVAKQIMDVLSASTCGDIEFCDDILRQIHPDIYSRQAHLMVNLQASEGEIREHFEKWLTAAIRHDRAKYTRDREFTLKEKTLQKWTSSQRPILPHRDLQLWFYREALRQGKQEEELLPSASKIADWLSISGEKDTVLDMNKDVKGIFNNQYCIDLNNAAASHSQIVRQPKAK